MKELVPQIGGKDNKSEDAALLSPWEGDGYVASFSARFAFRGKANQPVVLLPVLDFHSAI